jgi:hypothetical protein
MHQPSSNDRCPSRQPAPDVHPDLAQRQAAAALAFELTRANAMST